MPCFRPLTAYRTSQGSVVFSENRRFGESVATLQLPCGQCVGCRLERSRQWAVRCVHEAQCHESSYFVTLTYAPENLPIGRTLVYRHVQFFLKRLRKWYRRPVRYYVCGEYGEQLDRPHYHALLFGLELPDLKPYRTGGRYKLWTSAKLDALWGLGFCSVGQVTFESAAYCARYVMGKVNSEGVIAPDDFGNYYWRAAEEYYSYVDQETGEVFSRVPEFSRMSLRPGIGATWFQSFSSDVYPSGMVVARGVESKSPRYYDKLYKSLDAIGYDQLIFEREVEGRSRYLDNTDERLSVREQVTAARVRLLKRSI